MKRRRRGEGGCIHRLDERVVLLVPNNTPSPPKKKEREREREKEREGERERERERE